MIDQDGDENYQPMEIPITGGFPRPAFDNIFQNTRCHLGFIKDKRNICFIIAESRDEGILRTYLCHFDSGDVEEIFTSSYGGFPAAMNDDFSKIVLIEGYMVGDSVAYLWEKEKGLKLIYGKPLEARKENEDVPLNAFGRGFFTDDGLIFENAIFKDTYGLGYLNFDNPQKSVEIPFEGLKHSGRGEFVGFEPLDNGRFR
ncbi:MAG: S9 family peptidase, partial [Anaerolineales bacterium]